MTETRLDSSEIIERLTEWIAEQNNSRSKENRDDREESAENSSGRWAENWINLNNERRQTEDEEALRFTFGWDITMRTSCDFRRVHVCFFLCFVDVLFVSNAFISKPVTHLEEERERDKNHGKSESLDDEGVLPEPWTCYSDAQVLPWRLPQDKDSIDVNRSIRWGLQWRCDWSFVVSV